MAHDVFISYPSENKPIADTICNILESKQIRCWIAPRDIMPGQEYAKAVYNAIDSCKIFILVFSGETNYSRHIMSEVQRAFNKNLIIMPFRIENIEPSVELQYYIGPSHWLDALTPPIEKHIEELAKVVQLNLENKGDSSFDFAKTPISPDQIKPPMEDKNLGSSRPLYIAAIVILSFICLVVVANYAILPIFNDTNSSPPNDGTQIQPTTNTPVSTLVPPTQVSTNGNNINNLLQAGHDEWVNGNFQQAIWYYDQVLSLDPSNFDAFLGKIGVWEDQRNPNWTESLNVINAAKKYYPDNIILLGREIESLRQLGRMEDTIQLSNLVLEKYSEEDFYDAFAYADIWFNQGVAYYSLRNYEEAIYDFDKANSIYPYCLYSLGKGYALIHLNKFDEAYKIFSEPGSCSNFSGWNEGKIAAQQKTNSYLPWG